MMCYYNYFSYKGGFEVLLGGLLLNDFLFLIMSLMMFSLEGMLIYLGLLIFTYKILMLIFISIQSFVFWYFFKLN